MDCNEDFDHVVPFAVKTLIICVLFDCLRSASSKLEVLQVHPFLKKKILEGHTSSFVDMQLLRTNIKLCKPKFSCDDTKRE